ncbi:MAG: YqaE/Pmp3 family membrane protein [Calothrix sp. MO_192.B10]|nr:YqaE/Pmp3 family membrane protein [Calothrix sp. MO_192.B10]
MKLLLRLIIAFVIPPLGVFLTTGISSTLLINILLTLFGWLPGSIHAIWVILKQEEKMNREGTV